MGLTVSKCSKCNINKSYYTKYSFNRRSCCYHNYQNIFICNYCSEKKHSKFDQCCDEYNRKLPDKIICNIDFNVKRYCVTCEEGLYKNNSNKCYHDFVNKL